MGKFWFLIFCQHFSILWRCEFTEVLTTWFQNFFQTRLCYYELAQPDQGPLVPSRFWGTTAPWKLPYPNTVLLQSQHLWIWAQEPRGVSSPPARHLLHLWSSTADCWGVALLVGFSLGDLLDKCTQLICNVFSPSCVCICVCTRVCVCVRVYV